MTKYLVVLIFLIFHVRVQSELLGSTASRNIIESSLPLSQFVYAANCDVAHIPANAFFDKSVQKILISFENNSFKFALRCEIKHTFREV